MRIIQVIRSLTFGGAENHVLSLSRGLRKTGHDVLVAAPPDSWIGEQCILHGLPMEPLPMRGLVDLPSYWKLHRLIKSWRADIVHAHQVRPSQYVGIAAKATAAVPMCTAHSTGVSKHMRQCRHIIGVSDAVVENLLRHNYPRSIITRIYNGVGDVPHEDRKVLRAKLDIPDSRFAVVLAGRFHRDKGQDVLLKVAKLCPENVHFYFLGDAGTAFGKMIQREATGENRMHFLGYRNDVRQILSAFDLYVSPSRREAFSLSLAEAAAAHLPVVASRVGGIPEVVQDGETGILVPPDDVTAFADAIRKLCSDRGLAEKLGRQARLRYEKEFTLERMVQQTEQLYQKLSGKV